MQRVLQSDLRDTGHTLMIAELEGLVTVLKGGAAVQVVRAVLRASILFFFFPRGVLITTIFLSTHHRHQLSK